MSYVRVMARRDDGVEVEVENDNPRWPLDQEGDRVAVDIQAAADRAKAAITAHPTPAT